MVYATDLVIQLDYPFNPSFLFLYMHTAFIISSVLRSSATHFDERISRCFISLIKFRTTSFSSSIRRVVFIIIIIIIRRINKRWEHERTPRITSSIPTTSKRWRRMREFSATQATMKLYLLNSQITTGKFIVFLFLSTATTTLATTQHKARGGRKVRLHDQCNNSARDNR